MALWNDQSSAAAHHFIEQLTSAAAANMLGTTHNTHTLTTIS